MKVEPVAAFPARFVVGIPPPRFVIEEEPVGGNTLPTPGLAKDELVPGLGYEDAGGATGGRPYGVAGAGVFRVGLLGDGKLEGGKVPEVEPPVIAPVVGGKVDDGGSVLPPPKLPGGVVAGRSEMPPDEEPLGGKV